MSDTPALPPGEQKKKMWKRIYHPKPIPEELTYFFETGSALGQRYGIPRFEFRFRVVEVIWNIGTETEPHIVDGEKHEFKTYKAAERKRDEMLARTRNRPNSVLIQEAIVFWLTPDEMPSSEAGFYEEDDNG